MTRRRLIVNADDCNLTPGVTRAILEAHDTGIISSTTFLANLPFDLRILSRFHARPSLGVGLHLNITLGKPVSPVEEVPSLTGPEGRFSRPPFSKRPDVRHVAREYEAQLLLFEKIFGRLPTHLDTHHQLHDDPFFRHVLVRTAKKFRLSIRRCTGMLPGRKVYRGVKSTGYLFGNLDKRHYWRKRALLKVLQELPQGLSEIMCHPGYLDEDLKKITSFQYGRQAEYRIFRQPELRAQLQRNKIELVNFNMCYN